MRQGGDRWAQRMVLESAALLGLLFVLEANYSGIIETRNNFLYSSTQILFLSCHEIEVRVHGTLLAVPYEAGEKSETSFPI